MSLPMKLIAYLIFLLLSLLLVGCWNLSPPLPLDTAVSEGIIKDVRLHLEQGADPNSTDSNGTPILVVSMGPHGSCGVTRLLIEKGAKIDSRIPGADTALMKAAMWVRLDCVRFLLQSGADPFIKASDGKTALDLVGDDGPNGDAPKVRDLLEQTILIQST